MELFWLKIGNAEAEGFVCVNGKLQLDLIARRWSLDSWTLNFGGIALERVGNGESRLDTAAIRQLAADVGLGDGRSTLTALAVSGRTQGERKRGVPYWGSSDLLKLAPSNCDNKKARMLQEAEEGLGEPAILNFRPCVNKPEIPLQLAHRAFGVFLDIFHGVAGAPQAAKDDYQMFVELSGHCSHYLTNDNEDHRNNVWELWLEYTGLRLKSPFFTGKIIDNTEEDVGYELRVFDELKGAVLALIMLLEAKLAMCGNKSDPAFQMSQHFRLYWSKVGSWTAFANTCFPAIGIEHVGPFIRVSALANLGRISVQPLTPFVNLLNIQGCDLAAAEAGARLCLACKTVLLELGKYYEDVIGGKADVVGGKAALPKRVFFEKGIPYPLHGEEMYPVRLGEKKLLYLLREKRVVVKYVQREYGEAVHRAWAAHELAPQLLGVERLTGGWSEVRMEYLEGPEWVLLQSVEAIVADALRKEVVVELERAHRVVVGGGGVGVHGDMRDANVMVRLSPDTRQLLGVKFIDFDWARVVGVGACYPSFMNHAGVRWHSGAGDGKPMLQEHDVFLLSTKQMRQHREEDVFSFRSLS